MCVCVCMHVCVGSIMFLHVRVYVCVHVYVGSMCVYVCVFVCACPATVSAVLEFTFCSYCNHNHFTCLDVCICDSLHVCV